MASLPHSKTVTYEEWLRMPEVREAVEEVVNGEIRIMPPPKWNHAQIVRGIRRPIEAGLDERDAIVMDSSFGLVIRKEPLTTRVPDIAIFETSAIVEHDGYIHSAPQLIVEVRSPAKLADYAALGVPEAWVLSPEARTVEVLYLEDGQYRRQTLLAEGILKPRHFPGVQVDIARIWPD